MVSSAYPSLDKIVAVEQQAYANIYCNYGADYSSFLQGLFYCSAVSLAFVHAEYRSQHANGVDDESNEILNESSGNWIMGNQINTQKGGNDEWINLKP